MSKTKIGEYLKGVFGIGKSCDYFYSWIWKKEKNVKQDWRNLIFGFRNWKNLLSVWEDRKFDFGGIVIRLAESRTIQEYQGEFSIPWKRSGERKRIRFRAWSGNDAIYHLNRGRRETTISVPLGVLLLHWGRGRRGPGLHYRRPSLKLRLVTASDKPSPQPNKQTVVLEEERASASITPRRRENWNELVSSLALSPR